MSVIGINIIRKKETNLESDLTVETRVCTNKQQADNRESRKEKRSRLMRGEVAVRKGEEVEIE